VISVVVPAYNEEARLAPTLDRIAAFFEGRREDWELIIVDDGSRDRTSAIGEAFAAAHPGRARVLRQPRNRGKGAAVRTGVLAARGDEVLFSDADLATPIEELERLREAIRAGADVAIGSRAIAGADIRVRQHPIRELMGRTFNLVVRALAIGGIKDSQCGFKLFRADAARDLFGRATVDGFAFDVEILVLARGRWKVAEVPVVWRHIEASKVSPGVDAARMLWDVAKIQLRRLRAR
jgi:dolichyl-phosphate beta-glucosyltransferase